MSDPAITDHAELAAKAERCTTGDPWYTDDDLRGRQTFGQFLPQDRAFIAAANPARVLALLAEIAALRASASVIEPELGDLEATNRDLAQRLTQAERQRDEAVAAIQKIAQPEYGLGFNRLRGIARKAIASMEPKT